MHSPCFSCCLASISLGLFVISLNQCCTTVGTIAHTSSRAPHTILTTILLFICCSVPFLNFTKILFFLLFSSFKHWWPSLLHPCLVSTFPSLLLFLRKCLYCQCSCHLHADWSHPVGKMSTELSAWHGRALVPAFGSAILGLLVLICACVIDNLEHSFSLPSLPFSLSFCLSPSLPFFSLPTSLSLHCSPSFTPTCMHLNTYMHMPTHTPYTFPDTFHISKLSFPLLLPNSTS